MNEERKQSDWRRLWLWRGAGILTLIVFFAARFLMRDRLPVHEAEVVRQELVNTVSTMAAWSLKTTTSSIVP